MLINQIMLIIKNFYNNIFIIIKIKLKKIFNKKIFNNFIIKELNHVTIINKTSITLMITIKELK